MKTLPIQNYHGSVYLRNLTLEQATNVMKNLDVQIVKIEDRIEECGEVATQVRFSRAFVDLESARLLLYLFVENEILKQELPLDDNTIEIDNDSIHVPLQEKYRHLHTR